MAARGQDSGQPDWAEVVDALVRAHGSLAAVAERLAADRGHAEDLESVERALRRLRLRGGLSGGKWGARVLRTFGLPAPVEERLRFMGTYHSRFVDLPLPLCADLVSLWDRPPTSESRLGRLWLGLARLTLALRARDLDEARRLVACLAPLADADPAGRVELLLGEAYLASEAAPGVLPEALAAAEAALAPITGDDRHDLAARLVGQVAWALNRAGRCAEAEARLLALPDGPEVPAFARARRANGLAYARHRAGDADAALALARESARHAGDAGHVRLRAMALLMIARVATDPAERADARARARQIARALADPVLLVRAAPTHGA